MNYKIEHVLKITDGEYKDYREVYFVSENTSTKMIYMLLDPNNVCKNFFSLGRTYMEGVMIKREVEGMIRSEGYRLKELFSNTETSTNLVTFQYLQLLNNLIKENQKIVCVQEEEEDPEYHYRMFVQLHNKETMEITEWFKEENIVKGRIESGIGFPKYMREKGYNIHVVRHLEDVSTLF
ncbi:TPA: hypothetical protein ACGW5B_005534 [Bacillus paranthracis]|uniref:hypothetical protein n=1 Tax=Bacillus TaxID=1386 RepID=UPI00027CCB2E|nr:MULTISPECIES: hypothetical protein [unclassified Bacillus cereus group]AFQ13282.1 hypothetical protein BCK_27368 [Bacillus cereus FRI-35]MDX5839898.1 hypothetical protein [Bacillus cereus group sp. BfR-BA-01700]MDX5846237.1 hypothetical protein [Bacillus cereus group sp. BfR-BA-01233]MDX5941849.1 hypothetical protein [Bacillus cereus group sp. BfR-BA-00415]